LEQRFCWRASWKPTAASNAEKKAPKAGDANGSQDLMMTTADIALKVDPKYLENF
jgi:catalase-peroxidase